MKSKRILASFMALALFLLGFMQHSVEVKATYVTRENLAFSEELNDIVLVPGETIRVKLPVKAVRTTIQNPTILIESGDEDVPFTISKPKIIDEGSDETSTFISTYGKVNIEFDVKVKETAKIKNYKYKLVTTYMGEYDFDIGGYEKVKAELDFDMQIKEEKAPSQLTVSKVSYKDTVVGKDSEISFVVKNEGELIAKNAFVSLDYGDTGVVAKYATKKMKLGDVLPGKEQTIKLPVSILPSPDATAGMKTIGINFEYKDSDGNPFEEKHDIYMTLEAAKVDDENDKKTPKIDIESITYNGELRPGDDFLLIATVHNLGDSTAQNIEVSVENESITIDSFIKNYFTETITMSNLEPGSKKNVKIPLIVSKEATGGLKELKIKVDYTDAYGEKKSSHSSIYPEIIAEKEDSAPNLFIGQVKQSPKTPNAGGQVNVSFTVENKGKQDINDIKIITSMIDNTFSPINPEPYVYIEKLKIGEKRNVTIPLNISKEITEGLNSITIKTSYLDDYGKSYEAQPVDIPVLDVQNEEGADGISKPKLIISKFETDVSELRAGSTFNFKFDLKNTNASVAAKNITITISQKENVFTVTEGSNSFFIDRIGPGETVQNVLEMKVKGDASTNTYPLDVKIDYEYDGAEVNPVTGEIGESKTEELNLLAVENSRPVVDYVNVYSFNGNPVVNESATLSFEFYNMGKSPLNNVVATVEGDFTKADGNMNFIGNVAAGSSEYIEFDVIPTMEGLAKGVLTITFEDSNGDEVVMTKEFESEIQGETIWNPDIDDNFGEEFPLEPETKKPILSMWIFIAIQVGIIIIAPLVTKKIIIAFYKKKLRKEEEENY